MKPDLTVAIPVYNGEQFLGRALASLMGQSRKPDRVVVFDNCSTDGTLDLVRSFSGFPLEVRRNEVNLGLFGNHNRCLDLAQETDYLHILHADDELFPEFYATMLKSLETCPAVSMAWAQASWIKGNGDALPPIVALKHKGVRYMSRGEFLRRRARLKADIFVSGTVIRTGFQVLKTRFPEKYHMPGDHLFWAKLAGESDSMVEVAKELMCYRVHEASGTAGSRKSLRALVFEDWEVISLIEEMIGGGAIQRRLRHHVSLCFYSALMRVKRDIVIETDPDMAALVMKAGRSLVPWPHWTAGGLAFYARSLLRKILLVFQK